MKRPRLARLRKSNPLHLPLRHIRRALRRRQHKTHGIGIVKGNPKRCLNCQKEITEFELWTKYTSPVDPIYGAYSFIVHQRCDGKRK